MAPVRIAQVRIDPVAPSPDHFLPCVRKKCVFLTESSKSGHLTTSRAFPPQDRTAEALSVFRQKNKKISEGVKRMFFTPAQDGFM